MVFVLQINLAFVGRRGLDAIEEEWGADEESMRKMEENSRKCDGALLRAQGWC